MSPAVSTVWTGAVTHRVEAEALAVVAGRMRDRFPDVPPETVDAVVARYYREYDGCPIREFVPLLVERQVRDHLSGSIPAQRTSPDDSEHGR